MNPSTVTTTKYPGARRRSLITIVVLATALALGLIVAQTAYAAPGETTVINLDSRDIYLAYRLLKPWGSNTGDFLSRLALLFSQTD